MTSGFGEAFACDLLHFSGKAKLLHTKYEFFSKCNTVALNEQL